MKRLEYKFGVKIVLMIASAGECQTVSFNASAEYTSHPLC